jgi:parallel beta-helix repeat protein
MVMKKISYFFFFTLLLSSQAIGATYYVNAIGGNDSNNGLSTNNAWKTISKVNGSTFVAGDSILFKRGETWREKLTVPSSGSVGSPITFGAYGDGALPIISGADLVTTWTSYTTNVWQAALITQPNQVFFDNIRGTKEASVGAVNRANEWYWLDNVIYVYSISDPGTAYTNLGIEASVRNYAIHMQGKNYVRIDSLDTTKANLNGINSWAISSNVTVHNCTSEYNFTHGICGDGSGGLNNYVIDNNILRYNGGSGVKALTSANGWTIQNNIADHNGAIPYSAAPDTDHQWTAGLQLGNNASNSIVQYNTVSNNGSYEPGDMLSGVGIWVDTAWNGNIIRYNRVYSNQASGIDIERTSNTEIYSNIIYWNTTVQGGGGGIILTASASNSENNVFYNNVSYGNKYGIVVYSSDDSGATKVNNNIFKNNICFGNIWKPLSATYGGNNDGVNGTGNIYLYNNFGPEYANFIEWGFGVYKSTYSDWEVAFGGSTYSVQSDPLFVSTSIPDFHLQATSPNINAGVNVGLTRDYAGNPIVGLPDIGAYEWRSINKFPLSPSDLRIQ